MPFFGGVAEPSPLTLLGCGLDGGRGVDEGSGTAAGFFFKESGWGVVGGRGPLPEEGGLGAASGVEEELGLGVEGGLGVDGGLGAVEAFLGSEGGLGVLGGRGVVDFGVLVVLDLGVEGGLGKDWPVEESLAFAGDLPVGTGWPFDGTGRGVVGGLGRGLEVEVPGGQAQQTEKKNITNSIYIQYKGDLLLNNGTSSGWGLLSTTLSSILNCTRPLPLLRRASREIKETISGQDLLSDGCVHVSRAPCTVRFGK